MGLLKKCPPYMLKRVALMVLLEDLGGLDVFDRLPGVVAFGVPLPLDQVL